MSSVSGHSVGYCSQLGVAAAAFDVHWGRAVPAHAAVDVKPEDYVQVLGEDSPHSRGSLEVRALAHFHLPYYRLSLIKTQENGFI